MDNRPIGVFDSGVGGLSIWRVMRRLLPDESLVFFADSGHVPYGEKSTAELDDLTARVTRFLLSHDVKMIVIACNTATVHAIALSPPDISRPAFRGRCACGEDAGKPHAYWDHRGALDAGDLAEPVPCGPDRASSRRTST